jgi:UDP-N-acetylmuramoylalanine--D-glutamate ligase
MANRWQGKHVLVIGAARQGLSLSRYLASQGAQVTLNDQQSPEKMHAMIGDLQHPNITSYFGGHPVSLLEGVDVISVSGGIPLTLPIVIEAQKKQIPVTNDSQIFMEEVKAPVIAITGSAGKTTTTTLVGRMAELSTKAGSRAWLGGNIGLPLVDRLVEIKAEDLVILEISSFQLEQMTISPHIGAILNITPNHLDRHKTMEAYTEAKARLLQFQHKKDIAILNREDPGAWNLASSVRGELSTFGMQRPGENVNGTFLSDGKLCVISKSKTSILFPQSTIQIRGEHNLVNILAACAIGLAAGFDVQAMQNAVKVFRGVEHRLEWVRTWHGADWYNDSIATAPERTMAAIKSFSEPIVLLLGGRDKDLPWADLVELVQKRVKKVVVFGESAPKIMGALRTAKNSIRPENVSQVSTLHEAVIKASTLIEPGDVVLLSPGGTSFDEFLDFEDRGKHFKHWVEELA